jgi:hypothetical protein
MDLPPHLHPAARKAAPWLSSRELFTYNQLARRWEISPKAAAARVRRMGIPKVDDGGRLALFHRDDIAAALISRNSADILCE